MVGSKTICSLLMLMVFTFTSAKTLRDSSVKDSKSNVGVVGGITKKDPTEHKYILMAEDSLRQYEAQNNLDLDKVLIRVTEASEQVVAGLLTRLDFLAIPVCKQKDFSHQRTSNCQVDYIENQLGCHSELWDQPWLHTRQITVTCENLLTGGS